MNKKFCISWIEKNFEFYKYEGLDKFYTDFNKIKEKHKLDKIQIDIILHNDFIAFTSSNKDYSVIQIN